MRTVLIRLEGPVQSWGTSTRGFSKARRHTRGHPTKSGVVGLVANALGRDFVDPVDDLAALRFAVRADRSGTMESDYHTAGSGTFPILAGEVLRDSVWRKKTEDWTPQTARDFVPYGAPKNVARNGDGELVGDSGNLIETYDWYLADASFLAALSGPDELIGRIADALDEPARVLFLGRRAYLPSGALLAGVEEGSDPVAVLDTAPRADRSDDGPLPVWSDADDTGRGVAVVVDSPVTFAGAGVRTPRLEKRTWTSHHSGQTPTEGDIPLPPEPEDPFDPYTYEDQSDPRTDGDTEEGTAA